jgi:hypothetical protein
MVVLLTYGLCNRKKPVSHLTSAARLACSKPQERFAHGRSSVRTLVLTGLLSSQTLPILVRKTL